MKETLEFIVTSIVDSPDAVKIEEHEEDGILNLTIAVDPADMGKVIGKEGKVIRSIRNIMKMKAMKHDIRINVSLAEVPQE
jgi:predicted RNA-binding protein YlqC (UPF0109 family)